ncbi:MAG: TSUP family transporter [Ignavibacteriales bacterium]|nr:TSUP family transporter [Ignavibacteriales bacterium]
MLDSIWIHPILFLAGLAAGTIDSIAGGGGLITLPALLGLGFPPHVALGTNKFQSSFGSFTASFYYIKHGQVDLRDCVQGIIFTLIGTVAGTISVQLIHKDFLNDFIPVLLVCIIIYTFITPNLGEIDKHKRLNEKIFYLIFGLMFGFYDGFFGPGVGSFWAIAFVVGLGFNLTKATGYTKVMNFTSNIVSLIIFAISGNIFLLAGLSMATGQIIGARIGSGLVIKKGAKFIRPVFITIVLLTTLKLIYSRFF